MIFLAGSLSMNGGSTFLLRVAKEFHAREERITVLVLSDVIDEDVQAGLAKFADIVMLHELLLPGLGWVGTNQLAVFLPNRKERVRALLAQGGQSVHVMGIFGLILALRWSAQFAGMKISAGIYHQNEYLFNSSDFFCAQLRKLFRALPPKNVVYFNEFNRVCYGAAFDVDYGCSPLLPIGIAIRHPPRAVRSTYTAGLLVSIGNLESFKTYNAHIIRIVAELRHSYPQLRYEIYGAGPERDALVRLATECDALPAVQFMGQIPYPQFEAAVAGAMAFIGSGTALLEAAELAVPSIVGIESIAEPNTYGFISDVGGLSYNEFVEGKPLVDMKALIVTLLNASPERIAEIGHACALKAKEFSIDKTVNGFEQLAEQCEVVRYRRPFGYWAVLLAEFVRLAVLDRMGINRTLRNRRNQSTIA